MAEVIRFHLDENVNLAIASGLRRRGIDVTTSGEAGLIGASDNEQLQYARREGRVIVSQDTDFKTLTFWSLRQQLWNTPALPLRARGHDQFGKSLTSLN